MRNKLKIAMIASWFQVLGAQAQGGAEVPAPLLSQGSPVLDTAVKPATPSEVAPSQRIYIPVGDPNIKKAVLAIEPPLGPSSLVGDFSKTLHSDLDFSDLFNLLPKEKMPSDTKGMEAGTFNIDPYRVLGVEFLLKTSIVQKGSGVEAEFHLYDVNKGTEILGRRYPFVSKSGQAARELAHFGANDVVKTLTGVDGIFRTRILMSCGMKTKEIFMMDFDGENVRPLTQDRNFALSPSWAPDGKRIIFTSYKPAVKGGFVNPNLYLYDLISGQRKLLSAARGLNTGGVFHPKLNKIAYTFSVKARPEIYVLNLDNNTRIPITKTQFFSVEPSWSPDGSQLTYSSSQTGRPHIFVARADGSGARRLTFAGVYNSSPNWSPLGDKIIFSGQESYANNFNIVMVDPSGSNLVRLTQGTHSSENPVFSPDGRFVAFSSNHEGNYRINVMTAQGTKIRALSPANLGHCKQPAWSPRL